MRKGKHERGSAQVEFVLSIFMLLFLIFITFEMAMMMYSYAVIGAAAKIGVRYAIVHGTLSGSCSGPTTGCADSTGANVINAVKDYTAFTLHDTSGITISANYLDASSAAPSRVQVKISYPYIPYINLPFTAPTLKAAAEGRIVY
jgi:Flp pilus assembly protein TadG